MYGLTRRRDAAARGKQQQQHNNTTTTTTTTTTTLLEFKQPATKGPITVGKKKIKRHPPQKLMRCLRVYEPRPSALKPGTRPLNTERQVELDRRVGRLHDAAAALRRVLLPEGLGQLGRVLLEQLLRRPRLEGRHGDALRLRRAVGPRARRREVLRAAAMALPSASRG